MVHSLLNPSIKYNETTSLEKEDKDYDATIYEISLFDTDILIALGQPKYSFIDKNIVFYPLYLVKNDSVDSQIGVYEILNNELPAMLDDDGDINLDLLKSPLLYAFVDKTFITGIQELSPTISQEDDDVDDDVDDEDDIIEITRLPLTEQSAADAIAERTQIDKRDKTYSWIQKFMNNTYYDIVDNEGKGDCLFAVIRDGLKTVDKYLTITEMRKLLADNVTEELFQNYKLIYDNALTEDKQLASEIKTLAARHKELKEKIKMTKDRTQQKTIISHAEDIQKKHKESKQLREYSKELLDEFNFMKNVANVTQLKNKVQTCSFWGNTWAISTLERVLNIKLIILSELYYKEGDEGHVLQCGQLNDEELEREASFSPTHYILANHQGGHYQMITYKEYGAFSFNEIPYDIKMLVVEKCMERLAGPYYIIPEFREFKENLNTFLTDYPEEQTDAADTADAAKTKESSIVEMDIDTLTNKLYIAGNDGKRENTIEEPIQTDLYNNSTVFQFYSKSKDNVAPGSGAGELMGPEGVKEYENLKKVQSWRKMLSNCWSALFTIDGHKWLSVEHYYQGSKFKRNNPEFYLTFSLDSNSELSKNPVMAKGAGGKNGKSQGILIRPKHIKVDEDFFEGRGKEEMERAMYAKFSQNEDLKKVLLDTKMAKLTHYSRGNPPVVFYDLMRVRKQLKENN
jgi:predicted NAD-dependent protein-ADP-ribosyltransferase YbiA (DUF1768 family)